VLYGLDADLIMLAIATHEPHFEILREDVMFKESANKGCFLCGETGHMASECKGKAQKADDKKLEVVPDTPFILLHINVLREYLEMELSFHDPTLKWDLERALDDWVFLCFFVGNDFLPHLPSLEIRENAIDKLVALWKTHVVKGEPGYLTNAGEIDLTRVAGVMRDLGGIEDDVFCERRRGEERRKEGRRRRRDETRLRKEGDDRRNAGGGNRSMPTIAHNGADDFGRNRVPPPVAHSRNDADNKDALAALKAKLKGGLTAKVEEKPESPKNLKRTADEALAVETEEVVAEEEEEEVVEEEGGIVHPTLMLTDPPVPVIAAVVKDKKENDSEEEPDDSVRLWESGWKERYYSEKFNTYADDDTFKRE
jgi:5'-3' exoribonuclease 2